MHFRTWLHRTHLRLQLQPGEAQARPAEVGRMSIDRSSRCNRQSVDTEAEDSSAGEQET